MVHIPLLEAYRDCFPSGVVSLVHGSGREVFTPIMKHVTHYTFEIDFEIEFYLESNLNLKFEFEFNNYITNYNLKE
jgi:hypothetical protein